MELTRYDEFRGIKNMKEISGKKAVEAAQVVLDNYKKQQEKENIA